MSRFRNICQVCHSGRIAHHCGFMQWNRLDYEWTMTRRLRPKQPQVKDSEAHGQLSRIYIWAFKLHSYWSFMSFSFPLGGGHRGPKKKGINYYSAQLGFSPSPMLLVPYKLEEARTPNQENSTWKEKKKNQLLQKKEERKLGFSTTLDKFINDTAAGRSSVIHRSTNSKS